MFFALTVAARRLDLPTLSPGEYDDESERIRLVGRRRGGLLGRLLPTAAQLAQSVAGAGASQGPAADQRQAGVAAGLHPGAAGQALSKIERGFEHDLADVQQMLARGMIEPDRLAELYEAIEPELYRYPALDPAAFRRKLEDALSA